MAVRSPNQNWNYNVFNSLLNEILYKLLTIIWEVKDDEKHVYPL